MRAFGPAAVLLATIVLLSGCGPVAALPPTPVSSSTEGRGSGSLTLFAAASLHAVVDELEAAWSEQEPGVSLSVALDGSNVLATQIREGAPADVFLSADAEHPAELAAAGLTAAEPLPFASNHLALVAASGASGITSASDIARPGVRLVAAGADVPISRYAAQLLARLAETMPDAAGFLSGVEANIVSRETNVRAALAKVELGEGDAAIVYDTDVLGSGRVRRIALPAAANVSTTYSAVRISDSAGAAAFVDWLMGPVARDILAAAGFDPGAP